MPTARETYVKLRSLRKCALDVAERAAALTLVTHVEAFRDEEHQDEQRERLRAPYQMMGAQGVNNLSSKLGTTWLPSTAPYVRLRASEQELELLDTDTRAEAERNLAEVEKLIAEDVESRGVRAAFGELVKHLIIAGNVCPCLLPGKQFRVFPLSSYVNVWDGSGNLVELIIEEMKVWATVPEDLKVLLMTNEPGDRKDTDKVLMHTWVKRDGDKYKVRQEIGKSGTIVPGSETTYKLEDLPYLPLRWSVDSTQPYGYGLIEEYMGGLETLEGLTQAIAEGTAASVKLDIMVDPNGITEVQDLARNPNGGYVSGKADDVTVLQMQKHADLSVAASLVDSLERQLARVFLMNSAVTRNAERVTAEEIRLLQLELTEAHGGVIASLGQSLLGWLARVSMKDLIRRRQIPRLNDKVKPVIVTGIEALGRGQEANRLSQYLGALSQLAIPLQEAGLDLRRVADALGVGFGVAVKELQVTEEEFRAQQEQQNTQRLVDSVGSDVIRAEAQARQQPEQ